MVAFNPMSSKVGLVLTGGGARGAYQAGVLQGIAHIAEEMGIDRPFSIITGNSAGALNAAYIAAYADRLRRASARLRRMWDHLSTDQIFHVDAFSMTRLGARWLWELTTGALDQDKRVRSLLDTAPLRRLIQDRLPVDRIWQNICAETLDALAITAVNYSTGGSRTFFQSGMPHTEWSRSRRDSERTQLTVEHIMASTAIPLLFPPIRIGDHYYGDGSLRNYTPLSPAIKLGAEKLLVIGVRRKDTDLKDSVAQMPSLARILSVILNFVLLDAIDLDYETLSKFNDTLMSIPNPLATDVKPIQVCMLRPTQDIGHIAAEEVCHMPKLLRHMLRGLGSDAEASDLISYLLFEPAFTQRLTRLGYEDAVHHYYQDIRAFFLS